MATLEFVHTFVPPTLYTAATALLRVLMSQFRTIATLEGFFTHNASPPPTFKPHACRPEALPVSQDLVVGGDDPRRAGYEACIRELVDEGMLVPADFA